MKYSLNRRSWSLLLLLVSWLTAANCTCQQLWQQPKAQQNACNPHAQASLRTADGAQLSKLLKRETEGVPVCLQLGLGSDRVTSAQSQLLLLKQDGELQTLDQKGSPTFVLPRGSGTKKKRFRLFVFSPQFQGSKQLYCNGAMRAPAYDCLGATQNGTCLAYFEFRPAPTSDPNQDNTFPIAQALSSTCQLHLRASDEEVPQETTDTDALIPDSAEKPQAEREPDTTSDQPTPPDMNREKRQCTSNQCSWLKAMGGDGSDALYAVHQMDDNSIIVAGVLHPRQTSFGNLPSPPAYGDKDIFVGKLDRAGNWLWVRTAGSAKEDQCWSMAVSPQGDIYIGGHITEKATFGPFALDPPNQEIGPRDIFVAKLDQSGTWQWVVSAKGQGNDHVTSLATGPNGDVYVGGMYHLDIGLDQTYKSSNQGTHFIARLSGQGKWLWSHSFNTTQPIPTPVAQRKHGPLLATISSEQGALIVASHMGKSATIGPYKLLEIGGGVDAFVAQLDFSGKWRSIFQLQSKGRERISAVTTTPDEQIILAGTIKADTVFGQTTLRSVSRTDGFIAALSHNNKWLWARKLNELQHGCFPQSISTDAQGNIYVAGFMDEPCDFDGKVISNTQTYGLFAAKLDDQRKWAWAIKGGGTYPSQPLASEQAILHAKPDGSLAIAGGIFQPLFGNYMTSTSPQDLQLFIARNINR